MREKITSPPLRIIGGSCLKGSVRVSGAKNAVLPLLFSTLLAEGEHEFHNVPRLTDVETATDILISLGLSVRREGSVLQVITPSDFGDRPSPPAVQKMRAGILCLGPLLACRRSAQLPLPGGCVIGKRPVDLHLKGLRRLGASIEVKNGIIYANAKRKLKGGDIVLDFPTVGGTENLLTASATAEGTTRIKNIALEPEVFDLISYLRKTGARISVQADRRECVIEGVEKLSPPGPHRVIPDRISAGTFLLAGAVTGGELSVRDCEPQRLTALTHKLKECGFAVEEEKTQLVLKSSSIRKSVNIKTRYYPGFPTDLQAQFMALMTQLKGVSALEETVFENRFRHVRELKRLKAEIEVTGQTARIRGPVTLKGAPVAATDLRAGAGLALAGLVAEGETLILSTHHLTRGYDNLHGKLKSLGADIEPLPPRENSLARDLNC